MKKLLFLALFGISLFAISSCKKNDNNTNKPKDKTSEYKNIGIYELDTNKNKIYFGSYPQSLEKDDDKLNTLKNYMSKYGMNDFKKYNYFSNNEIADLMYYYDIDLDDNQINGYEYRCVYIKSYRPNKTSLESLENNSNQNANGYEISIPYYFKFEKIEWDFLEDKNGEGFLVSNLVLDSMEFYSDYSTDKIDHNNGNGYVNNYSLSNVRKWLNNDFYKTAFNAYEKEIINKTEVDNSSDDSFIANYLCENTSDKLFLVSEKELNRYYPLASGKKTTARICNGTDYALANNLYRVKDSGCEWMLRTPAYQPNKIKEIMTTGEFFYDGEVNKTSMGVRPACKIEL